MDENETMEEPLEEQEADIWEPREFARKLKRWHDAGWWTGPMVRNAYRKLRIDKDELDWILGPGGGEE